MIKGEVLTKWLHEVPSRLCPPGTETDTLEAHSCLYEVAQNVSLMIQHRFAFYFWAEFLYSPKNSALYAGKSPILVSIDYHYDVGYSNTLTELDRQELEQLDLENGTELGLYCWLRLNANNDAHIQPALYMRFFSDVYILLKKSEISKIGDSKLGIVKDLRGISHRVKYYCDQENLIKELKSQERCPIYLDVDLDYFIREGSCKNRGTGELIEDKEIRGVLSLKNPLMSNIFHRIVGLTIALEPICCGGIENSMHLLKILNEEFFGRTLLTDRCKWNI